MLRDLKKEIITKKKGEVEFVSVDELFKDTKKCWYDPFVCACYRFWDWLRYRPRAFKYFLQYCKRGFSDRVTWSLKVTIAKFVVPRFERFIEVSIAYPGNGITAREWNKILHKILKAFKLMIKDRDLLSKKEIIQINDGLQLFAKWWMHLGW